MNPDGSYTYTPKADGVAFDKLAKGEQVDINLGVTAHPTVGTDGTPHGADFDSSLNITLKGTNDAPVVMATNGTLAQGFESYLSTTLHEKNTFTVDNTGTALKLMDSETATWGSGKTTGLTVRGNLNDNAIVTDVDHENSQLSFFGVKDGGLIQNLQGTYGMLMLLPNGEYQYVLDRYDADYKALGDGVIRSEKFTIYVRDDLNAVAVKPIELIIKVQGGNGDESGLSDLWNMWIQNDKGAVKEDGAVFAKGSIREVDVLSRPQDHDVRLVGYKSVDEKGEIIGMGNREGSSISTKYGTLTLLPDGRYTYILNNDAQSVQELCEGETITETFYAKSGSLLSSKDTAAITIVIKGNNDKPYEVGAGTGVSVTQDDHGNWSGGAGGKFAVADRDHDETGELKPSAGAGFTDNGDGTFTVEGEKGGTFTVTRGSNGEYTYTYKAPDGGKNYSGKVEDTAKLTLSNGPNADDKVTVDLKASLDYANDAPKFHIVMPDDAQLVVTEDGGANMVATGQVTATDPDVNADGSPKDKLTFGIVGDDSDGGPAIDSGTSTGMQDYIKDGEKLGTLIMDKKGNYEFHLNTSSKAVQELGKGESRDVTFKIQVDDGQGGKTTADLTVTINGANDAPVISLHKSEGAAAGSGEYFELTNTTAGYSVGGVLHFSDVDASDKVALSLEAKGETGTTDKNGVYGVAVYAKHEADGTWVQCDSTDTGNVKMGTLVLDSTGGSNEGKTGYRFVGDPDGLGQLAKGATLDITATVKADDGNGGMDSDHFTVAITGTNNIPVIKASPATADIKDDGAGNHGASSVSGTITATDADSDARLTYSIEEKTPGTGGETSVNVPGYGTLTIDNTGKYTFELNDAGKQKLTELGEDEKPSIGKYILVVKDQHGGTARQDLDLQLIGRNDAPEAAGAAGIGLTLTLSDSLIPDSDWATDHKDISILASDADKNDHLSYSVVGADGTHDITGKVSVPGLFGTLNFDKDTGEFHYQLNTDHDNLVKLAEAHANGTLADGTLKETFNYTAQDSHHSSDNSHIDVNVTLPTGSGDEHAAQDQLIFGGAGNDTLHGGTGNDILSGGTSDDILYGGAGDDILYGGAGHNQLYGGDGNDTLYAGNDGDHLYGGDGNDHLYGGTGSDFLDGGANTFASDHGGNHLNGGAGNDLLVFHPGDVIDGGEGLDFLLTSNPNDNLQSILGQTSNVEVAIKGGTGNADAPLSLTSLTELLKQGITVTDNSDGSTTMTLNKDWSDNHDGTYTNSAQNLTLSTAGSLASEAHDDATEAAKFILTNSHA